MSDVGRPERRQRNPWVIGVGSSIAAAIVPWALPTMGSYLLTLSGQFWHGSIDDAYRHGVILDGYLMVDSMVKHDMGWYVIMVWLQLLIFRGYRLRHMLLGICYGVAMVTMLMFLWISVLDQRSELVHETYERRMMILTPAFSEGERKALVAEWGQVASKADYDRLMSRIEALAKNYEITLPPRTD